MLQTKDEQIIKSGIGIIVGRFQVSSLHPGHVDLIDSVRFRHNKVIIVLGSSPLKATKNNPLDYTSRKSMINEKYPDILVLNIKDNESDIIWSKNLDELITDFIPPECNVVIYGSRDCFAKFYFGKFPVKELIPEQINSGTELRIKDSFNTKDSEDFRCGVIWTTQNQSITNNVKILAIIKKDDCILTFNDDNRSFINCDLDFTISSNIFENSIKAFAIRHNINVGEITYSTTIINDDWMLRKEPNKNILVVFTCKYLDGNIDKELNWTTIDELNDCNKLFLKGYLK